MKTRTKAQTATAALAVLLALTACGSTATSAPAPDSSKTSNTTDISQAVQPDAAAVKLLPQSYKDKGELTVAMDLHYPPTTFLSDDNKTPIGLNPDIARLVAKKLGLKLKFENTVFDTIIPGIDGGRYDFTITTMSPTPERLKVLDMIDYFKDGNSIAVSAGNPLKLTNETLCGKNIAVTAGSTGQLKRLPALSEQTCTSKGQPAINSVTLPNVQEALTQLASKRIDGILYDTTSLAWAGKQQPGMFTLLTPQINVGASDLTSVGLKKGSPLTPALQAAVQSVLNSPEYKQSLSNWGLESGAITDAKLN
ncbi:MULTISPECIES: ABC transporter substrate-binding protein [Arthrobacter]|jgi:polar amino acid transport system substrate-binding protein|uniref:Polar amino acid transport system substrate-binding protein n=1 Tax=Arthrobacter bambusae TaxID=1338426 RepID=A0AAW8DM04_9MICC|nr:MULTISPECIES: ABC transporter substrate-binding protein [Arthrobacter]MDP9907244.1 polar amino acid transport system substrate-binding protein [Arthrobacter bambusae]MDQ0131381.1 polar amino acid transport system substrate-binding protein [Arthrobacter bambusae]MDQ0182714.1 polar amino acid transport system substrate-binding protein [Arthrobacter bambusae]MDQ0241840.1 polar amino acid transport system substrate-binding protein [Arthrobacter bambusae]